MTATAPAKLSGLTLVNSIGQQTHRALDFYPTPPNVTIALMEFLKLSNPSFWEPACGSGMMSRVLEKYGPCVSTELQTDMGYGEGGRDFLKEKKLLAPIIVTNPPFNLSVEFIKHGLALGADMVAMLLKSQYWHGATRYQLFKEHPPAYVLPLTWRPDFNPPEVTAKLEQEKGAKKSSPTMEVAWSVWQTGTTATRYIPLPRPR